MLKGRSHVMHQQPPTSCCFSSPDSSPANPPQVQEITPQTLYFHTLRLGSMCCQSQVTDTRVRTRR